MPAMNGVTSHPAETAGLAAAVAVLIVSVFSISDPQVYGALIIVVGAVPAAVTFLVELVRKRQAAPGPSA
jgi:hypothetical protein